MTNNPYSKIKNNSILTASPQELTLMLYDGAIKFANQSKAAIENKEYESAHNLNLRVQAIIEEFRSTLDMRYEVSEGLDMLYEYIESRLIDANIGKDIAILDEVVDLLRDLRNTWKEAMQLAKQPSSVQQATVQMVQQAL